MKNHFIYGFLACCSTQLAFSQITINEVDSDTVGADEAEFIELFNAGDVEVSLDGFALVFFNGGTGGTEDDPMTPDVDEFSPADAAYLVQDLAGQVIPAGGFFVFGNPNVPNVDLVTNPGTIQNGSDAVALYNGDTAAAYVNESETAPLTTDLIDALVYETGDADDIALQNALGVMAQFDESAFGLKDTQSIQRNPDGSSIIITNESTPGATNFVAPELSISLDATQISEEDGVAAAFGEVRRSGDVTEPLTIDLVITAGNDSNVISLAEDSVTFSAGAEVVEFVLDAISNTTADGDAIVSVEAREATFTPGEASLAVIDDETPFPTLVINEVLADQAGPEGPEYIELFNSGPTAVSLDGFRIEVFGANPSFSFGEERNIITIESGSIAPNGFFTIGNELVSAVYGVTPDQLEADLDLDDFEYSISLVNADDEVIFSALSFEDPNPVINNRAGTVVAADIIAGSEDGFAPSGFFLETDGEEAVNFIEFVAGDVMAPSATPTLSNRTPQISIFTPSVFVEEGSMDGIEFTVTRLPRTEDDLVLSLTSSDPGEVTVPSTVTILGGETTAIFLADAVTDDAIDGSQLVTITAAVDTLEAASTVTILDIDADPLQVCDVAFVAVAADNPDLFSFVTFAEISGGTQINFTDNGWLADGGFRFGEGILTWIAPAEGVPAGSVITFTDNVPDTGSSFGAGPILSAGGDQLFAYQGPDESPTLIAGIQMNGDWDADATDTNTSALPAALDPVGSIAITPEVDNVYYSGITSGTPQQLKAALGVLENYTTSNARFDDLENLVISGFVFGEPSDYSVSLGEIAFAGGQFTINFTATGASDVYVTTDLEIFTLATNGGGVVSGSYVDTAPPADRAFYLIQEAGTPAP